MFIRRREAGRGRRSPSHQLLESYRDAAGRTRHRVVVGLGPFATIEAALEAARAAGDADRVAELEVALERWRAWQDSYVVAHRRWREADRAWRAAKAESEDLVAEHGRLHAAEALATLDGADGAPTSEARRLTAEVIRLAGKVAGLEYEVGHLKRELKAERDRAFKAEATLRAERTDWEMQREILESYVRLWRDRAGPQKPEFEDMLTPEARARWAEMQAADAARKKAGGGEG